MSTRSLNDISFRIGIAVVLLFLLMGSINTKAQEEVPPTTINPQLPNQPSLVGAEYKSFSLTGPQNLTAPTVGYYDMFFGQGVSRQVPAITSLGYNAVQLFNLSAADLSGIDILLVQNPVNDEYGAEYLAHLAEIQNAVNGGMTLIIHDRFVNNAESVLPGGGSFNIVRDFTDDSNIDVLDTSSSLVDGPAGTITNSTLDGGCSSSHGHSIASSLPANAHLLLSRTNSSQIVTFSYPFGSGHVIYSTIPLDFYLNPAAGCNAASFRNVYAPNVLAYAASLSSCDSQSVLVIYDVNNANTQSLVDALTNAGMTVTLSQTPEYQYNGTNPSPSGFDAVIHMNGSTPYDDMPTAGQQALVAFVQNGGGYIGGAWNNYEYLAGRMQHMRDLILLTNYIGAIGPLTLTDVPSEAGHPVLANVPATFNIPDISFENGTIYPFAAGPASVLMRNQNDSPILSVREFGNGRVVHFAIAPNWLGGDSNFSNTNVQQIYIDSIKWSAGCGETNTAPSAVADVYSTDEDTPLVIPADGILDNDSDADTDALTAILVTGPANAQSFTLNPNGSFNYTSIPNFNGVDSFTYKANDGQEDSNVVTVQITVNAVNDPPTLADVPGNATIAEEAQYGFTATATDIENSPLVFSLVGEPDGASIDPGTGAFSWTPSEAQGPGVYSFGVRVSDGVASTDSAISITVSEVNVAPHLGPISNQTGYWGNAFSFTAAATDPDIPANTLTFNLIGAPAGASINGSTGTFAWTPASGQIGSHTFTVRVTDNGSPSLHDEQSVTINVGQRPTALIYTADGSEQYSDQQALSALLVDAGGGVLNGTPVVGRNIGFAIGSQNTSGSTNGSGVASANLILTQDPAPAYSVVSTFAGDSLYLPASDTDAFDILQEDARTYYTGIVFANTACATCSGATATLSGTIKDITAEPIDSAYDVFAGDIRNASVTFINRDTNTAVPGCSNLPVGLVDPSDQTVGTATCNWNLNLGVADSLDFTIGIIVSAYYTRNDSGENTLVTISKPIGTNFITGGGYLINALSNGQYAGLAGFRTNFGFNVKYNNSGKNLQGNVNAIVRGAGGRVYQVKGNVMRTLSVRTVSNNPLVRAAVYTGKANVTDITDPLNPIALGGNNSFQMELTDNGEPGAADTIGITVWNDAGGLLFSSRWNGTRTVEQILGGGNVVVR